MTAMTERSSDWQAGFAAGRRGDPYVWPLDVDNPLAWISGYTEAVLNEKPAGLGLKLSSNRAFGDCCASRLAGAMMPRKATDYRFFEKVTRRYLCEHLRLPTMRKSYAIKYNGYRYRGRFKKPTA